MPSGTYSHNALRGRAIFLHFEAHIKLLLLCYLRGKVDLLLLLNAVGMAGNDLLTRLVTLD